MEVNKVDFNGNTLIDLTNDTVTSDDLPIGVIAHNASGERISGTRSDFFTLTNVNGWKRALEFTGNGLAIFFSLSAVDAIASVSGVLNAAVNASCLISQLSSRDIDRLHKIDKAAILFRGDRTCLFIHTSANIANIKLVINGAYQMAVLQNENEELPDGAYVYNFGTDTGIIADEAIAVNPEVFKKHEVVSNYKVATNDEIQNAIDDAYNNTPNNSYFEFIMSVNAPGLILGGGVWYFKGFRNVDVWGWVEGKTYWSNQPKYKRNKMNGEWRDWIVESFSRNTVTRYEYTSNVDTINAWLENIHNESPDHGHYEGVIGINTSATDLPAGMYYVTGYRQTLNTGGYQEAKSYIASESARNIKHYVRSRYNGTWTPWRNASAYEILAGHYVKNGYTVSSTSELDNALNDAYDNVVNGSVFEFRINVTKDGLGITGGLWYASGFKNTDEYGFCEVKRYGTQSNPRMQHKSRSKQNGTWGEWITISS